MLSLLVAAILAAIVALAVTPAGRQVLSNPHDLGGRARNWADAHPAAAEVVLVTAYTVVTLVAMPTWWLNVLAGYSFGLIGGTARCVLAAAIAASITAALSRWLAADYADHHIMNHLRVARRVRDWSRDGGLLLVMLTRLLHVLPFGLSNYLFGILGVPWYAVFLGTLVGNIPAVAIYVALGCRGEWHSHWLFIAIIATIAIGGLLLGVYVYARHLRHPGDDAQSP